jgi:uncharacterized protein
MSSNLDRVNNPWLRIITAAGTSFSIVTIVSAVAIGLFAPQNKSAHKLAVYASLLATVSGAALGLSRSDRSTRNNTEKENGKILSTKNWQDWRNFVVDRKTVESEEITSFYLKPQDAGELPDFKPGQFLTIKLDIPEQQRPVIRTYSLSDYSQTADYYRLSIKRELAPHNLNVPSGVASNFMHDFVVEGSIIPCKPPSGNFFIDLNSLTPAVLISNGVGITPMISMAKACNEIAPTRHLWFLHGARNGAYHAHRQEVNEIADSNLHIHYSYSRPQPEDRGKYHTQGYIDRKILEERVIPEIKQIYGSTNRAEYYLCGSPAFMDSIQAGLKELGVAKERIFFESFTKAKTQSTTQNTLNSPDSAEIVLTRSRRSLTWTKNDGTILEFAEANDIDPPYSCRQGICLTCMCKLEEGEVEYIESPTNNPDPGAILICISQPKTSKVVLDL